MTKTQIHSNVVIAVDSICMVVPPAKFVLAQMVLPALTAIQVPMLAGVLPIISVFIAATVIKLTVEIDREQLVLIGIPKCA
jgi:hypothetical protein